MKNELKERALIGNLLNAASDVLDPWNQSERPRSQYMHRFRDQYKKLLALQGESENPVIKELYEYLRETPKATKATTEEISRNLLIILGKYGYSPTRDIPGLS